jgi:hypothetical protein
LDTAWGEERIYNMVAHRPDWVISRQRVWGVPIVAFYCAGCDGSCSTRRSSSTWPGSCGTVRARTSGTCATRRPAARRHALPTMRRRALPQGDGHPRRVVRLRLQPRRVLAVRPELRWPAELYSRARTSTADGSSPRCSRRSAPATRRPTARSSPTASWWTARAARCRSRAATTSLPTSCSRSTGRRCCACGWPRRTPRRTSVSRSRS